ncbi:hypothetical protein DXA95_17475 [Odoribacter sp. OF09-27XD]|nr:hypothetical protein DXA95_17475 [Odoribacter sp. OF09-27XD]
MGNLVYRVTGSSFVFESGLFGEGVVSSNGICYHLKDHLAVSVQLSTATAVYWKRTIIMRSVTGIPAANTHSLPQTVLNTTARNYRRSVAWVIWTTAPACTTSP